jgi:hypothetical protein
MTTDKKKLVDRVRKLLALGESDNANESAAAMAAAQRLMTQHSIESAMLEEPEEVETPEEPITIFDAFDDALDNSTRTKVTWKTRLSVALARHNACKVYLKGGAIHLVGRPTDVATIRYFYKYCVREVERLTKAQGRGHGRTWYNNYRLGVVETIGEKLRAMKKDLLGEMREKANRSGGTALVLVNNAIAKHEERTKQVTLHVKQNMKLRAGRTSYSRYDGNARQKGRRDGRSINLNGGKGLGSGTRRKLGS